MSDFLSCLSAVLVLADWVLLFSSLFIPAIVRLLCDCAVSFPCKNKINNLCKNKYLNIAVAFSSDLYNDSYKLPFYPSETGCGCI